MNKVEGTSRQPGGSRIPLNDLNISETVLRNEPSCQRDKPWISFEAHDSTGRADLICQHMQDPLRATSYINDTPTRLDPCALKVLA